MAVALAQIPNSNRRTLTTESLTTQQVASELRCVDPRLQAHDEERMLAVE